MSTAPEPPPLVPIRGEGYFGGASLLAADARVASLFADEARRRTMERLFGIPRTEKSGLATLIALLALAEAMGRQRQRVHTRPPTLPGVMTGVVLVREVAYGVAGPRTRESSYLGTLMAFALMGAGVRLAVRGSARRARSVSNQAFTDLHHRYGRLIRPNRRASAG